MKANPTIQSILFVVLAFGAGACLEADADTEIIESALEGEVTPPTVCEADLAVDATNCGACGTVCASGLCYAGVCADDRAGHVFAIGHSYRTSNPALDRLLGNAVFMPERRPVRVLSWSGTGTTLELVTNTNAAIKRAGLVLRDAFKMTAARTAASVPTLLANAEVFLVYAQPLATDDELVALGQEWSLALDDFTRRGGIVVVLDAPGTNAGTSQLLAAAGLLTLTERSTAPGALGYVAAHDDAAAARVPLTFAIGESVGYAPSGWTDIATTENGQVLAVHRAVY